MNSNFYIPAAPQLKKIIHSIWQVDRQAHYDKEYIIPKGIVEIIFNFSEGGRVTAMLDNNRYHLPGCFINGFNDQPVHITPPKRQVFFGVQLQPLAIKQLFKTPGAAFANKATDLTLVDSTVHSLWHELAGQTSFDNRVNIFCRWAEQRSYELHPQDEYMDHYLYDVQQYDHTVTSLSKTLCYSPRHLSRKIFETTGMNTEEMLLYKKYLHAVHLMHHSELSLTQVAYQSQFTDQSHFIRSFKAYTQLTPGQYRKNKGMLKGHLYGNVR